MGSEAESRALVLFSGGQDSATCLAWALDRFDVVETIAFDYGQTHKIELQVREAFLSNLRDAFPDWSAKLGPDRLVEMGFLADLTGSALTGGGALETGPDGLPTSFVPGRNLLFLAAAASYGYERGLRDLVIGAGEVDFSGYPDCRDATMKALVPALSLGLGSDYDIHAPLMRCDKASTWALARELGGDAVVELILEHTHSCYRGVRDTRHDWGYGCGDCPACTLRAEGWRGYVDWFR